MLAEKRKTGINKWATARKKHGKCFHNNEPTCNNRETVEKLCTYVVHAEAITARAKVPSLTQCLGITGPPCSWGI
jgi:hypothetical protein